MTDPKQPNNEVEIDILNGTFSNYCSLIDDDAIDKIVIEYNKEQIKSIIDDTKDIANISNLSGSILVSNLVYVKYLNSDGDEVEPKYHNSPEVKLFIGALYDEGMALIESVSRYDNEDTFEALFTFEI